MNFTPLETLGLAGFFSLMSAVATRLLFSNKFVTRVECTAEREKMCAQNQQIGDELSGLRRGQQTQFRMLRAIIVHSSIPADKQEEILNDR